MIIVNKPESYLDEVFKIWVKNYEEQEFSGFKYYWSSHRSNITVYRNSRNYNWEAISDSFEDEMKKFKEGIDLVIKKYRQAKDAARSLQLIN